MWWSCQALQTKQNWIRSAVKRELSGRWGKSNLWDSEGDIQLHFHLCSRETILWCGTEQIMKTSHRMEHINAVNFGSQGVKGDFCIEKCYECIFFHSSLHNASSFCSICKSDLWFPTTEATVLVSTAKSSAVHLRHLVHLCVCFLLK